MSQASSVRVSELIARARQGDTECREQLFALCRSYARHLARDQVETSLRRKVDASDVVQQTMLEAYCGFEQFRGSTEKELLAWLRQILSHNVADFVRHYLRTAKRELAREVPFRDPATTRPLGAAEPAAAGPTPSQQVAGLETQLQVIAALDQLPPDYQEVIVLRNLERLAFAEVAKRMGRSRPAVQMLWMRAIRKLQGLLGEVGKR